MNDVIQRWNPMINNAISAENKRPACNLASIEFQHEIVPKCVVLCNLAREQLI